MTYNLYLFQIPNGEDYKKAIQSNVALRMMDRIDDFLSTHELRVNLPEELGSSVGQINVPLTDQESTKAVKRGRSEFLHIFFILIVNNASSL